MLIQLIVNINDGANLGEILLDEFLFQLANGVGHDAQVVFQAVCIALYGMRSDLDGFKEAVYNRWLENGLEKLAQSIQFGGDQCEVAQNGLKTPGCGAR